MNELHDRINRVINTLAFEKALMDKGVDLIEFQTSWHQCRGSFDKLPASFQAAIIAGEAELAGSGEMVLA